MSRITTITFYCMFLYMLSGQPFPDVIEADRVPELYYEESVAKK